MAIRVGSTGARAFSRLTRTTGLPSISAWTIMFWCKVNAYPATNYGSFVYFDDNADTYRFQIGVGGATWGSYWGGGGGGGGTIGDKPATGTWVHIGATCSGTSGVVYVDGSQVHTATEATGWTPAKLELGGTDYDAGGSDTEQLDANYASIKIFDVALTGDQLRLEMRTYRPQGMGTVHLNSPGFVDSKDYSGNAKNWTETGTIVFENDGPPVGWGATPYVIRNPAAGPGGRNPVSMGFDLR